MDKITKVLMNLIKVSIQKEKLNVDLYKSLSDEEEKQLYKLCSEHSLGIIAGDVLGKSEQIEKTFVVKQFVNEAFMAMIKYEQSQLDKDNITKIFDGLLIPYIVLKGPRVREFYPKPEYRTSCDIDILIKDEDIDRAVDDLVSKGLFEKQERNYHDIPMVSPQGVLLELHFNIKENTENLDRVLVKVWDNSFQVDGKGSMEYKQSNEFFLFHLLAHMAYHYQHGGCGIRSVLDIYLICHQMQYDEEKLIEFCKEAQIATFYNYIRQLSEVWFGNEDYTSITIAMEEYILHGGTYGTKDNYAAVGQTKQGGHLRYMLSRIFVSYDHLRGRYPALEGRKWMIPFYQIKRWNDMIKKGNLKTYIEEFKLSKNINKKQIDSTEKLLKVLELD